MRQLARHDTAVPRRTVLTLNRPILAGQQKKPRFLTNPSPPGLTVPEEMDTEFAGGDDGSGPAGWFNDAGTEAIGGRRRRWRRGGMQHTPSGRGHPAAPSRSTLSPRGALL